MSSDNEAILTIGEAAAFLRVHEQTVRKLARRGAIPCFKVGRDWRFRREALIQWSDLSQPPGNQCSVLVIDDDESVCRTLSRELRRFGCSTRQAGSGEEGLELVEEETPDLILLDLKMPGMGGPRFLEELRMKHPTLPVVIVTGYPESDLVDQAMRHAPILLLAKPVDSNLLERTIRSVILEGASRQARAGIR